MAKSFLVRRNFVSGICKLKFKKKLFKNLKTKNPKTLFFSFKKNKDFTSPKFYTHSLRKRTKYSRCCTCSIYADWRVLSAT